MGTTIKNDTTVIVLAVLGALLIGAVVVGSVRPTMVETGAVPTPAVGSGTPEAALFDPAEARVRGGSQSSGWSLFGLTFGGSTTIRVELPVSRDCFAAVAVGDDWPLSDPACGTDLPGVGTVTAREDQESLGPRVVVELDVSKECYTVAAGGSRWPTGLPQCADEETTS